MFTTVGIEGRRRPIRAAKYEYEAHVHTVKCEALVGCEPGRGQCSTDSRAEGLPVTCSVAPDIQ